MDNSLRSLLQALSKDALLNIAFAHHLPVSGERKSELVALLVSVLGDPQRVHAALAEVPPQSRQLFQRVQDAGGRVFSQTLMREWSRDGQVRLAENLSAIRAPVLANREPTDGNRSFAESLSGLLQRGLLFGMSARWLPTTPLNLTRFNTELLIAREVLAAAHESNVPLEMFSTSNLERHAEASAQNMQRDVYLYWNYVREQRVTLTAAGFVSKRHLAKLNDAVVLSADLSNVRDESQTPRLHFMRTLMEATGLIRRVGQRLEAVPSAQEFFAYSITRRTDRFFEAWKRSGEWNELLHLPIQPRVHEPRSGKPAQLFARARQYVLTQIEAHGSAGWLSLTDLMRKVRMSNYEFLFKRTREDYGAVNPYYYFHNPLGWGFPVGDESEGWDKVECEFIRNIVYEPLHWLGIVSLGYQHEQPVAFRLTPLGEYLFGLSAHPPSDDAVAVSGKMIVQPNFQIFALEPIAEQTLAALDRFADRVKADKAYEYHLTRESVYRAQQNGMGVTDVIAFLTQYATAALPQNVLRSLEDWGEGFERIVVRRNVAVIHALEPQVLDALQADAATHSLALSRPLPRVLIAAGAPQTRELLMQVLASHGHLAATSDPNVHDALILDEQGKVNLLHPVPDIYLIKALERHAERLADGYYLTERIVKSERNAGDTTDEIIARWQQWHHGPLPQKLLTQIRRWGRFYGAARIAPMRLIQLPSADLVEELLLDAEVGPFLHRYAPDPKSVFVCDEDVERVRVLLESRGIVVQ